MVATASYSHRCRLLRAFLPGLVALITLPAQAMASSGPFTGDTEFAEQFAPFDVPPPLYEPDEETDAVDLSLIDPPLEGANIIQQLGSGIASYYGRRFHGRRTANGERFDMHAMTAAHKTLPFGSKVRVTNPANGKSVTVRINDRGPFTRGRTIDLSRAAAREIGLIRRGHAMVELALVE